MRVAAVQHTAGADRDANLAAATPLVARAAEAGARLVVLPELFSLLGPGPVMRAGAEGREGPTLAWAAEQARRHGIWLVAGSYPERLPPTDVPPRADGSGGPRTAPVADRTSPPAGPGAGRYRNTSCLVSPAGEVAAAYAKIHLFDNDVPGAAFRESDTVVPGDRVVTAAVDGHVVGLSVCYDLRFPELYRRLAAAGADVLTVPAAFTAVTGRAHWEVLLRARAVENQCVVIAAGQVGPAGNGLVCHGHSMIVDPWGEVLAEQVDGPGVVVADVDADRLAEVRATLPALHHRRPDLFP